MENHPAAASTASPAVPRSSTTAASTVGPDGSIPQVIKQCNDSFRDDFTVTLNGFGRHDLKVGGNTSELLAA